MCEAQILKAFFGNNSACLLITVLWVFLVKKTENKGEFCTCHVIIQVAGRPSSLEFELSGIWWRGRLNGHVAPQPSPEKG